MKLLCTLATLVFSMTAYASAADSVHDFKMNSIKGKQVDLSKYKGKVLLIVNTASRCGLTPHYEHLQAMHEKYADKGLVVLGFPCNQFGKQEPGSDAEISEFCVDNYGVEFPMFSKIEVNGDNAVELYKYLKKSAPLKDSEKNSIRWNFEKFVVGKDGKVAERFSPRVKPNADELVAAVEEQLAK